MKMLLIIRQMELIRKKKFIVVVFDPKDKVFIVYIIFISRDKDVYPFSIS